MQRVGPALHKPSQTGHDARINRRRRPFLVQPPQVPGVRHHLLPPYNRQTHTEERSSCRRKCCERAPLPLDDQNQNQRQHQLKLDQRKSQKTSRPKILALQPAHHHQPKQKHQQSRILPQNKPIKNRAKTETSRVVHPPGCCRLHANPRAQEHRRQTHQHNAEQHPYRIRLPVGQITQRKKQQRLHRRTHERQRMITQHHRLGKLALHLRLQFQVVKLVPLPHLHDLARCIKIGKIGIPPRHAVIHPGTHPDIAEQHPPEKHSGKDSEFSVMRHSVWTRGTNHHTGSFLRDRSHEIARSPLPCPSIRPGDVGASLPKVCARP